MGIINKNNLIILRRLCFADKEYAKAQQVISAVSKAKMTIIEETTKNVKANGRDRNEVFWMKDPRTGNWMPENRFEDVDVADLRKKLLSKTIKI